MEQNGPDSSGGLELKYLQKSLDILKRNQLKQNEMFFERFTAIEDRLDTMEDRLAGIEELLKLLAVNQLLEEIR